MKTLLIDMDEVLVDFVGSPRLKNWGGEYAPIQMYEKGFFKELKPIPGAIDAINSLISSNFYDIYICTQPVARSPHSYSEKIEWIAKYIPDLIDKVIMTQNKNIIKGDILIDDNQKWANFGGKFIHFVPELTPKRQWKDITKQLLTF